MVKTFRWVNTTVSSNTDPSLKWNTRRLWTSPSRPAWRGAGPGGNNDNACLLDSRYVRGNTGVADRTTTEAREYCTSIFAVGIQTCVVCRWPYLGARGRFFLSGATPST